MEKEDRILDEVRDALIGEMADCGVRKEMCLPVLLMLGKYEKSMLVLAVYCRDVRPDEHHVIQAALYLDRNPPRISDNSERRREDFDRAVMHLKRVMEGIN